MGDIQGIESSEPVVESSAVETPSVESVPNANPTGEVVQDAYTPDLSYVVHDKKLEFDPFLKDVIKDKDTEKKIRDLYTKAAGLDFYKEKYTDSSKKLEETVKIKEENDFFTGTVQRLNDYRQKGNYRKFFEELGLTDKEILQYAYERVNYQELPQDQKQLIDSKYTLEQQSQMQAQQLQQYEQQLFQQSVQARGYELEMELSKPDISDFASRFDSMVGKPGAFKEEIIRRGQTQWHVHGVDAKPAQLAQEIMGTFASIRNYNPEQPQAMESNPMQVSKKPTIPNIQGGSSSPVKKQFTSIADLKKARDDVKQQNF